MPLHEKDCAAAYKKSIIFDNLWFSTYVFGNDKFQREMALAIGRRTWRGASGRPHAFGRRTRKTSILIAEVALINVVCPLFSLFFGVQSFSFRRFLESKALALGVFWSPKL